jgi:hypothetical protein
VKRGADSGGIEVIAIPALTAFVLKTSISPLDASTFSDHALAAHATGSFDQLA